MKQATDYTSRMDESMNLLHSENESRNELYAKLSNIFYRIAGPIEAYEYKEKVNKKVIRADIRHRSYENTVWVDMNAERAGFAQKTNAIMAAGLRGIFEVVRDRYKTGRFRGNGHHARQEACANALIKINQALDG